MSSSRVTCDLKPAQATGQAAMAGLALLDRSPQPGSQAAKGRGEQCGRFRRARIKDTERTHAGCRVVTVAAVVSVARCGDVNMCGTYATGCQSLHRSLT